MKLTKLFLALAASGLLAVFAGTAVQAASKNQSFQVSATVIPSCNINSVDNISFGAYNPLSAAEVTATGEISITCSNNAPVSIGLTGGDNFSAATNNMKGPGGSGTELLRYKIFQPDGTTQWSDSETQAGSITGSGSVLSLTGQGSATPIVRTMIGRMPGSQNVSTGVYTDTVYAVVNF
jgi:spore coat protein U-like protein